MYLIIEDNPNCAMDERVFSESGEKKTVKQVRLETPTGDVSWCDVVGVNEGGASTPASAVQVEDSGAGTAWLIFGGNWGLRFRKDFDQEWSLTNKNQWGRPFLVFDSSGEDIHFE